MSGSQARHTADNQVGARSGRRRMGPLRRLVALVAAAITLVWAPWLVGSATTASAAPAVTKTAGTKKASPALAKPTTVKTGDKTLKKLAVTPQATGTDSGTVTGVAFRDYNANGQEDTTASTTSAIDVGVGGVTVTAYDSTGAVVGTATTSSTGAYSLAFSGSASTQVRVKFTIPSYLDVGPDGTGTTGVQSGGQVQFVSSGGTANLGMVAPGDYCASSPVLVVPCQQGVLTHTGAVSSTSLPALESIPYSSSGDSPTITANATTAQVGAIGGSAVYTAPSGTEWDLSAALFKYETFLGPSGLGGLYATNLSSGTANATAFATVANVGTDPRPTENPNSTTYNWGHDPDGLTDVGRIGLGDVMVSADQSTLYVSDIYNNTIVAYPIIAPTSAGAAPTAGTPTVINLPTALTGAAQGCSTAYVHSYGLGQYDGTLYATLTCVGPAISNLRGYVYSMNESTDTFASAPSVEIPLNYDRGCTIAGVGGCSGGTLIAARSVSGAPTTSAGWNPWDDPSVSGFSYSNYVTPQTVNDGGSGGNSPVTSLNYPMPDLSQVSFTSAGNMQIGVMDRFGNMIGQNTGDPTNLSSTTLYSGQSAGDELLACGGPTSWTLESNGTCGSLTSASGSGNRDGPGGGEYYVYFFGDNGTNQSSQPDGVYHEHTAEGSTLQIPGFADVTTTNFDPTDQYGAGGVRAEANANGANVSGVQLYSFGGNTASFGKASGLGEISSLCGNPPVEIGDRLWIDTNGDGIQEPGEPVVAGATVTLESASGAVLATTTTNAQGYYTFSSSTVSGLTASTNYIVAVDTPSDFAAGGVLAGYVPTVVGAGSDPTDDSNGTPTSTVGATSAVTSPAVGATLNTDFGFVKGALSIAKSASPTTVTAAGQSVTYSFLVTNTGTLTVSGIKVADTFTSPSGDTLPTITCPTTTLAAAASTTCTATYTVTQADMDNGSINNSATVSGTTSGGSTVTSAASTATVTATAAAALTLAKSASPTSVSTSGQTVNYSFAVTNTGNVTVSGLKVADTFTSPSSNDSVPTVTCPVTTLAPAASTTCTAAYTVTAADISAGVINNSATVSGTSPAGATVTSPASTASVTVTPASALLACTTGTVYSLDPNTAKIYRVDTATGVESLVGTFTGTPAITGVVNGLAATPGGQYAYGVQAQPGTNAPYIYRYNTLTGTTTTYTGPSETQTSGTVNNVMGAIDPSTGIYYFGTVSATGVELYGFNTNTNTAITGRITTITGYTAGANGDLAFSDSGQPYFIASSGNGTSNANPLVSVNGNLPTTGAGSTLTGITVAYLTPTTSAFNGLAFDESGNLFAQALVDTNGTEVTTLYEINPDTGATILSNKLTVGSTAGEGDDLAACTYNNTISVQANITGRNASGDQFGEAVTGGGLSLGNTGTTTGTTTGIQNGTGEVAGPDVGLPGTSYTITETASGTTNLSNYVITYSCLNVNNGNAVVASGSGTTATFTFPAESVNGSDVVCTFTNSPVAPAITVVKSASPTSVTSAGSKVSYSFLVTNTGNVALSSVSVTDTFTTPSTADTVPTITCPTSTLAVGAATTCTASYTTTQADIDNGVIDNSATAAGTSPQGTSVTSPASTATVTASAAAAITIVKSASPTSVAKAGNAVSYSFVVTNSGNVTLKNIAVTDTFTMPSTADTVPTITCPATTLAPAASTTCTATYTATQTDIDNGVIDNSATATGTPPTGAAVTSAASTASVTATSSPTITIVKSASPTSVTSAGAKVSYSFVVTNTGNVTLKNVAVTDTFTTPSTGDTVPTITCPATTLAPSAATTCTATYTATQTDIDNGVINNSATATGTPPTGAAVTSPASTATVTATSSGALTLTKSASPTSVTKAGNTVTYSFLVTNTGNVTLKNIAVADTFTSPSTADVVPAITCPATTLAPGAATTCTASYTVTQADVDNGVIDNSATVSGTNPSGTKLTSAASTATVTAAASPAVTIVKSASPTSVAKAGNTVSYSFVVTNTGNVTLKGVTVADTFTSPSTGDTVPTITCPATTLAPAASTTCTATYTATQTDIDNGVINNSATATGTPPTGAAVTSAASTATVTATAGPGLTIVKSASPTSVPSAGTKVAYSFLVTNTGNVTLRSVSVADTFTSPSAGDTVPTITCPTTILAVGTSTTCTATYTATQTDIDNGVINNSATATGTPPTGAAVTSPASTATVTATSSGALTLTKSASPTSVTKAGNTVTYSFLVTNTGNVTLKNIAVADTFTSPSTADVVPAITCPATTLAPGAATTCTASYTVTQADVDNGVIDNSATVSGTNPSGTKLTSAASTATVTAAASPAVTIVKSASPTSVAKAGNTVSYSFVVTNTGNVTLKGVTVADTFTSPSTGDIVPTITCPATTLAPAASTTCTATYTATQTDIDNGVINNSATATGTPPTGAAVTSAASTATVTATATAGITLLKSASPTSVTRVGQTISYSFLATNTGNVTLTGLTINDTLASPAGPQLSNISCPVTTLAPEAATTCTASYTVTQADVDNGSVSNSATASGNPPTGATVTSSPPSTATVSANSSPAITIVKSASPTSVTKAGNTVTYSFLVTNTGNVTLKGVAVADTFTSPSAADTVPTVTCPTTTLASGASTTCTASYTATQADIDNGVINNSATATGTPPTGAAVTSAASTATVTASASGALTVTKSASPTSVTKAGSTVTYSFLVTNTGNVTLTGVAVADTFTSPSAADTVPAITCPATTLAPGAATTCTASYTVTQADVDNGVINNSATVSGTNPSGTKLTSAASTATVTATAGPAITVVKSASPTSVAKAGNTVSYSFLVTNTGNVTLRGVTVADTFTAPSTGDTAPTVTCPATTLAPSATTTCTASYPATQADLDNGVIDNSATATGTPPTGAAVTSPASTATVTATPAPALTVVKSASPTSVSAAGAKVSYSFVVTNTGNVTLKNVAVTDTFTSPSAADTVPAVTCPATTLAVGASTTCTASYTTTQADIDNGVINNSATATGTPPTGSAVTSAASTATVTATPAPALTVVKSASPTSVSAAGAKVSYTFVVTNTGNVTLKNVAVTDTFTSPSAADTVPTITCPATTLAPSVTTTCTASYTATQADINNGVINNSATATGTPPTGTAVTSTPSTASVTASSSGALTLTKSASPTAITTAGTKITYSFLVTNTGNVTLTGVAVTDTFTSPSAADTVPTITCPATTLAPAATTTCTASYTATQADVDNGVINNSATVSGTNPSGTKLTSAASTATVTATAGPAITVVKSASPTSVTASGQKVSYSFVVTNTGNVTLKNVAVADAFTAPSTADTAPTVTCPTTPLAPSATTTCTASYTATQADIDNGSIANSATASGAPPTGAAVTSSASTATVTATAGPGITVVKSATPTSVSAAGAKVSYSFVVTNTGNVTLKGVAVTDTFTSPSTADTVPTVTCPVTTLAPAAATTCTASYTATQADIDNGVINNSATASGTPPTGAAVTSAASTASVTATPSASLTLVKSASPTSVTASHQSVIYSFLATNTGNVTLTNLVVNDTFSAPAAPALVITCPTTTLAPSASTTCTGSYTTTQNDINNGSINNSATVSATTPAKGTVTSPTSTATVTATPAASIKVVKSANPTSVTAAGQTVSYTFLVTNTGNVALTGVGVNDAFTAPSTGDTAPTVTCPVATLNPSVSTTCTASYTVTAADLDNGTVNNSATATGTPPTGTAVTSPASTATVTATPATSLALVKSANPTTVTAAGQTVNYSFQVTNNGNQTLSGLAVTDSFTSPSTADTVPTVTCPVSSLAASATTTCTAAYTTTQADIDNGVINNSATAAGKTPGGTTVTSAASTASVTATQTAAISVVKSASPTTVKNVGSIVSYSFLVTNTGNVTLANMAITDTLSAPAGPALTVVCPQTTLAPAGTTTCTASYTVSQADVDNGSINNSATARGVPPTGPTVRSTASTATVTVTSGPALSVVKSAAPTSVTTAGTAVNYSFVVTNTGNVTLSGVAVTDTFTAPSAADTVPTVTCPATTLASGASTTCTASYTATQADIDNGVIDNSATATGTPPTGAAVTSPASTATVTATSSGALTLTKSASPTSVTNAGSTVTYSFVVTNTGNVTVKGIAVADTFTSPSAADAVPTVTCPATTLAPGAVTTCTASYPVTQADIDNGVIDNSATVSGTNPSGTKLTSAASTATVTAASSPAITIVKSASPTAVSATGAKVTYSFAVTNTGNVTLKNVAVADTFTSPSTGDTVPTITCPVTTLAPAAKTTCNASYTTIQSDIDNGVIDNSATATGTPPTGSAVTSAASTATVTATAGPALTVVKSASPASVSAAGAKVSYSFVVTNTGNVTLKGVAVTDTFTSPSTADTVPTITCPVTTLAPAAATTCTASYTTTQADIDNGVINNSATASGTPPTGPSVTSAASTASVTATPSASLTLVKSASPTSVSAAGAKISYSFVVTNTGNVTLKGVTVTDTFTSPSTADTVPTVTCPATTLAPAASTTCSASYTTTQADIDSGVIDNSATATGTPPTGAAVTSAASTASVTAASGPALAVVKSASPSSVSAAGTKISYSFVVTNTGNVTLTNVAVTDKFTAPSTADTVPTITCPVTTLAPAASTTCTATYTTTQADIDNGSVANSATVSGTPPTGAAVTSAASTATVAAVPAPAVTVVKSASPTSVSAAGQKITYSFVVTDTGNVRLRNLAVTDAFTSPSTADTAPTVTCPVTTLNVLGTTTCTASYTATQADLDNGVINNSATVSGTPPTGAAVTSAPSTATVTATSGPAITVVKSATPSSVSAAGAKVSYSFVVTNTGNVTLTGVGVTDTFTSPSAADTVPAVTCPAATLAPTTSTTCTASYTATQADIDNGVIDNSATATGTPPTGAAVTSAPSTASVSATPAAGLTVVKTASPTTVSAPGTTITYSFLATNTGNVTLTGLTVNDTLASPAGPQISGISCPVTVLAPTQATTCTGTYVATQADIDNGSVGNSATVSATTPAKSTVTSPTSTATVTATPAAALSLTKSASPTTVTAANQTVTYSFLVTNTGNVTVSGLTVDDAFTAPSTADTPPTVTCPTTSLAPGVSTTCTGTYTSTQADVDSGVIDNSATVAGTTPAGAVVTSPGSTATVTATGAGALSLVKSASPTSVTKAGNVVTYSFAVTNSGNLTLTGVGVTDAFTGPSKGDTAPTVTCPVTTLSPGAGTTCTATYTVVQSDIDNGVIDNSATASGTTPAGTTVISPSSTATVTATAAGALTLVKSASPTAVTAAGQAVAYSFLVTNSGNVTLSGVKVKDAFTAPSTADSVPTITCPATTLAPGATTTCSGGYTTTQADVDAGVIDNSATVSATTPAGTSIVSPSSTATVTANPSGALTVAKSASPTTVTASGQQVKYSFAVTNTGNVTVSGLAVTDAFTTPSTADTVPTVTCPTTSLTPGAATTCTAVYTTTQADIDAGVVDNSATVSGTTPAGTSVTSPASTATVTATPAAALALVKSATPSTVTASGQTISYSFAVTNSGNVTVSGIAVKDTFTAPSTGDTAPSVSCPATSLAPGASTTCTATYTVTQTDLDNGAIDNSATVSGTTPAGAPVTSPPSTASVTAPPVASLTVVKSASPTTVTRAGNIVSYSFAVTNGGNVALTAIGVTDTFTGPSSGDAVPTVTCPVTALAPGGTTTCTASYPATQGDIDSGVIDNSATVTGTTPTGTTVTSPASTATVTATPAGALSLVKSASPTTVTAAGQSISYTFAVTNTGNVTVSGLAVKDTLSAPAGPTPTVTCPTTVLAPSATTDCTASYVTTQADVDYGSVDNSATVSGTTPGGAAVTSPVSNAAVTAAPTGTLTLVKTASPTTVTRVGQQVTYTFVATNTGNVTLTGLSVSDIFTAPAGPALTVTCPTTTLAPAAQVSCSGTYSVTQADVDNGTIKNTATVSATSPAGTVVTSAPSTATVTVVQAPAVSLTKSADPSTVTAAGGVVQYSFAVTNTGNVTLTNLAVTDAFTAPSTADHVPAVVCPVTTLGSGDSTTCTASYTVTQADIDSGVIDNSATVSGIGPSGTTVTSSPSTATVTASPSAFLTLVKSASPTNVSTAGSKVTYSFAVTNTGNVTVSGLAVSDGFTAPSTADTSPTVNCPATVLAPGAMTTCTATYTVTQADIDNGSIANSATASGTTPAGGTLTTAASTATVTAGATPALTLVKSASPTVVTDAGSAVTYSFVATNTGNVTLRGLGVTDTFTAPSTADQLGSISCPSTTLTPGASTTCTAPYTVTQADVDAGVIHNSATVSGTTPAGAAVTSAVATATVTVTPGPALTIVKSALPTSVSTAGQRLAYIFDVTNTGNVTVSAMTVNDVFDVPSAGDSLPTISCPQNTLAPGQTTECSAPYIVTQGDVDNGVIVNSATASGTSPSGTIVTSPPSTAVVLATAAPALTLVKSVSPTSVSTAGQAVTYSFVVTNTGNVTVTGLTVADKFTAPSTGDTVPKVTCPSSALAPGADATCTATYTVTQADVNNGVVDNSATVSATTANGSTVTSPSSTATLQVGQSPGLDVTKSANPTTVTAVGANVTYSFLVANTGNVTLSGVTVADTFTAPSTGDALSGGVTCPSSTLAPGTSTVCTASYTTTQSDLDNGVINNSASVTGTEPDGTTFVPDGTSTATVVANPNAVLTLVKSATPSSVSAVGATVDYSFLVTDTGNVTLSDLAVTDTFTSPSTGDTLPTITCPVTTLAPSGSTTCTASYSVTQADLDNGVIDNSATVSGATPAGKTVQSSVSTATVTAAQSPSLSLAKSASPTTVGKAGQKVTYSFLATNTGNVPVTGLSVTDTFTAPSTADTVPTITCPATTLAPGKAITCTATYTVTQPDVDNGVINNSATVSGTSPMGTAVTSDPSTATVTATPGATITLVKSASPTTVSNAGATVTYSFLATNTGNVTLTGLAVTDTFTAPSSADHIPTAACPVSTLAPGAATTCTASYTVTQADVDNGLIDNSATVSATTLAGATVTSPVSTATVTAAPAGALTLVKSALPTTVNSAGVIVNYSFVATNTGNETLTGIAVTDTFTAPSQGDSPVSVECPTLTLAPGDSTTCTGSYTSTQSDLDNGVIDNSAIVSGTTPAGGTIKSPPSTATVTASAGASISLVKSADPTTVTAAGQPVTYSFLATNTGDVTLTGLAVTDSFTTPSTGDTVPSITCPVTKLDPGVATTCTAIYTVTQTDVNNGVIDNSATVAGTTPAGKTVRSAPSTASVTADQAATVTLVKSAAPTSVTKAGQKVTYSFLATNTGNVTLTGLAVADTFTGVSSGDALTTAVTCPVTTLAPGRATTCTASYTVTQADIDKGVIDNSATVSATAPTGATVISDPSTATVTASSTALSLVKSASPTTVSTVGSTVTYSFLATNTGNVTLTGLAVADTFTAPSTGDSLTTPVTCPITTLVPNATTTCTATYTVTAADLVAGVIDNSATVSGSTPGGATVTSPPSTAVVASGQAALSIAKSASPTTVTTAGQKVTYSFVVDNTGTVTVTGIAVDDTFSAPSAGDILTTPVSCPVTVLAAGATTTCTATYTVTQADVDAGVIDNSATVSGTNPSGSTVTSDPSTASVTATAAPAITLVKSASPATVTKAGQQVTYSFLATNTGNVTLTGIAVTDTFTAPSTDDHLGVITCPATTLAPGRSTTCVATYTVTQSDVDNGVIDNSATVSGVDPAKAPVTSDPSTAVVTAPADPGVKVVKSASPTVYTTGTTITYSFLVTNTGNVTIANIDVKDTFTGPSIGDKLTTLISCPTTTLAPGRSTTCTATYVATAADVAAGAIDNSATAAGTGPGGGSPVPSPPSTATVTPPAPSLTVVKSASPTTVTEAGQTITYSFLVTNTGNETLTGIAVTDTFTGVSADDKLGPITCPVTKLAAGATTTCTATYTVTAADIARGSIRNTATVSGVTPGGTTVTSPPSTVTVTVTGSTPTGTTPPTGGSNPPTGGSSPPAGQVPPVSTPGPLAFTGMGMFTQFVTTGLLSMLLGLGLVLVSTRRRRRSA